MTNQLLWVGWSGDKFVGRQKIGGSPIGYHRISSSTSVPPPSPGRPGHCSGRGGSAGIELCDGQVLHCDGTTLPGPSQSLRCSRSSPETSFSPEHNWQPAICALPAVRSLHREVPAVLPAKASTGDPPALLAFHARPLGLTLPTRALWCRFSPALRETPGLTLPTRAFWCRLPMPSRGSRVPPQRLPAYGAARGWAHPPRRPLLKSTSSVTAC